MDILLALEIKVTGQASYKSWHLPRGGRQGKKVIPFEVESAVKVDKQLQKGGVIQRKQKS